LNVGTGSSRDSQLSIKLTVKVEIQKKRGVFLLFSGSGLSDWIVNLRESDSICAMPPGDIVALNISVYLISFNM
jgi:hypothetical protein